ncbi:MAG: SIMPL domain-containing protein [Thermodesulfobacteriota bacterium]
MQRIILSFLVVVLFIAGLSLPLALGAETPPNISVEAEGKVLAIPDLATLTLEVETQAATAAAAAQENARQSDRLLKALKPALGSEDKVRTLGYRLFPVHSSKDKSSPPEIKGYRAVNRLEVKIMDLTRLGSVLDTALNNGASRVDGPYFRHSRMEELQRQAAVDALERARRMAEALAQAANLKIKGVDKISTGVRFIAPRAPVPGANYLAAKAAPPTPIEVGEEEIRAHVQAVYLVSP